MAFGGKSLAVPSNGNKFVMKAVTKDKPRSGTKEPAKETLLTPRFYTTDFDEMERVKREQYCKMSFSNSEC